MSFTNVLLVSGSANFSTRDVWDGYRVALEECGIGVIPYPTFSFLNVLSNDKVCSDILGTALDVNNRIDGVIFVDGLFFRGQRSRIPLSIRRAGIPTVLIATDDPYEQITNGESLYTYRFTNEIRCEADEVSYLPTGTLPLPSVPVEQAPGYDLSFVGTVFPDRSNLLLDVARHCERKQRRFLIAGKFATGSDEFNGFTFTDIRQKTVETPEKLEIYAQSRLTLNIFRESDRPADSPSPRVFEVSGLGHAALVTGPHRAEVRKLYGDSVYHFNDSASMLEQIELALSDDADRRARATKAREITEASHLYQHRAASLIEMLRTAEQTRSISQTQEDRIAWIIGCGRTGSTWLSELLADLPKIRRWHEPYFGRFLKHVDERPEELDRTSSFFARRHQKILIEGLRELFFKMVHDRYPQFGRHSLVVKEVNTPEIYEWLRHLFPAGRLIHLVRDPFDTLDSYLDLQKPGSWNQKFGDRKEPLLEANVRRTAEHIRTTMLRAQDAFEAFPEKQRLLITYEELLTDPVGQLKLCGELIGVEVSDVDAERSVEKHSFEHHKKTGTLEFRRKGKSGVWKTSKNFTPSVQRQADEILGPVRTRFGYSDDALGKSDS